MYIEKINQIIALASENGARITSHGARLFGSVPHVAPEAWFHVLFNELAETDILALEKDAGRSMHLDYVNFLQRQNGASFFSGNLELYGNRLVNDRSGDAAWQPFDLVVANTSERPRGSPETRVYIGGYSYDGSSLAIDSVTGLITRHPRRRSDPILNNWPSLDAMLSNELDRLSKLFDSKGRLIGSAAALIPS